MIINRLRRLVENITIPVLAVILGLLASVFFVALANADPIQTYRNLFCEGFGPQGCETFSDLVIIRVEQDGTSQSFFSPFYGENGHSLAVVVERATILILTALSATVAFKAGMFSIGMDGQLVLGALTAVFLGVWLPKQIYALAGVPDADSAPEALRTIMHLIVPLICILAAMTVGAFYSWIAGFLKVKLNVNELISTIILNSIATQVAIWLIAFPLRSPDPNSTPRTDRIDDTAWLIPFNRVLLPDVEWLEGARVGIGIVFALIALVVIGIYLYRTTAGYEQRMTRGSRLFARFGGIPSDRAAIRAMLISGALSGLAGAIQILGVDRRVVGEFASVGYGFDGVLVAILARESIAGILLVACFYAGLQQGATNLQFGNLPRQLGGIIIAFIILFNSMENFFRSNIARLQSRIRPNKGQAAPESASGATS